MNEEGISRPSSYVWRTKLDMKRRVTCYASSCLKFGSGLEEVATMFHLRYFRRPLCKVKLGRIWDASTGDNELPGEEKREIQET